MPPTMAAEPRKYERTDRPICRDHGTVMVQYARKGNVLYFRCSDKQCPDRAKTVKKTV